MSSLPRILYVCSSWPHDRTHGGQLRALNIGRALKQIGDVTVLVVNSDSDSEHARQKTAAEFRLLPAVHSHTAPNGGVVQKLRWAFDPQFLNIHGTIASDDDRERVLSLARDYDMVWVMNARTPSILQIWRWPRAHLDVDDIPSAYLKMAGRSARDWISRWKARTQRVLLHRRERRFRDRFSTLSVCSDSDRAYLGGDRIHVIPNGFVRPTIEPQRMPFPHAPRIGFIGLYSYAPNIDGVRWFLREVWPVVQRSVPGARFRMIGKDTDGSLKPEDPAVDALGWVADPADEIATWSAMVVPIRFGGGTRIKLADAFSRKCPVVSTSFGAHGYNIEHGKQALLADTPLDFAAACIDLLCNHPHGNILAEAAWHDFLVRWTWDAIKPKIWAAADDCLRQKSVLGTA